MIHGSAAHDGVAYRISQADLSRRKLVQFHRPAQPVLKLADLTGSPLKKLGLSNDVSATDHYEWTQHLAAWIWAKHPHLDGIRYVSRQLNTACCYALFDRSAIEPSSVEPLDDGQLTALCLRYCVEVISL